jgi:hypothetical protein
VECAGRRGTHHGCGGDRVPDHRRMRC